MQTALWSVRHFLKTGTAQRRDGGDTPSPRRANKLWREEGSWSAQDLCYRGFIMKVFKLIEGLAQPELADNDMAPRSRLLGRLESSAPELRS